MSSYIDYLDDISPTWLNDPGSKKFKKAFGDASDQIVADAKTALNQIRIDTCDDSALEYHRRSSSLLAGKNETSDQLRSYLKDRWEIWKLCGTRNNIIRDLGRIGFTNSKVWSWLDLIYSGATRAFGGGYAKLTDGSLSPISNKIVEYMYVEPNLQEYKDYYAYNDQTGEPAYFFSYYINIFHVPQLGSPLEAIFSPYLDPTTNKFIRNQVIVTLPCDDLFNPLVTSRDVANYINTNGVYDPFSGKRFKVLMCNVFSGGTGTAYVGTARLTRPNPSFFFVDIGAPNGFSSEKKWNAVTDNTYVSGTAVRKSWVDYVDPVKTMVSKINGITNIDISSSQTEVIFVANSGKIYLLELSPAGAIITPWTLVPSGVVQNLNAITSRNNTAITFIVGNDGKFLRFNPLTLTVENDDSLLPTTTADLLCVDWNNFYSGGAVYAAGKNGTMLWRNGSVATSPGTWAVLALGASGLTVSTTYYGVTQCYSMTSYPESGAYFCGYDSLSTEGIVAFFNRSTGNLSKLTIPVTNKKLNAIQSITNSRVIVVVGDDGLVLRREVGSPWQVLPKLTNQNLNALCLKPIGPSTEKIYAFGEAGIILEYDTSTGVNKIIRNLGPGYYFTNSHLFNLGATVGGSPAFAVGWDAVSGNALMYNWGDETYNLYSPSGATPLADGALWNDNIAAWDIKEPYDGAIGDIKNIIKKWKPASTSCRYIAIRVGDRYISIPMFEHWELDANGTAKFDFYNHSFASDPSVEYTKILNSIYYKGY